MPRAHELVSFALLDLSSFGFFCRASFIFDASSVVTFLVRFFFRKAFQFFSSSSFLGLTLRFFSCRTLSSTSLLRRTVSRNTVLFLLDLVTFVFSILPRLAFLVQTLRFQLGNLLARNFSVHVAFSIFANSSFLLFRHRPGHETDGRLVNDVVHLLDPFHTHHAIHQAFCGIDNGAGYVIGKGGVGLVAMVHIISGTEGKECEQDHQDATTVAETTLLQTVHISTRQASLHGRRRRLIAAVTTTTRDEIARGRWFGIICNGSIVILITLWFLPLHQS
mmetsp:Transcript_29208/g.48255  ORF Transcript_29208/g.48255 Transcript_29208/m.48255 type:complete len:277 (+) Transcript_29208:202-1032(+)